MSPALCGGWYHPSKATAAATGYPPPSTKLQVLLLHGTGYRPQGQNRSCCCVGGGTPPRPAGVVLLRGVVPPMGPSESTATRQTELFVENGNGICVSALYRNNVHCVFLRRLRRRERIYLSSVRRLRRRNTFTFILSAPSAPKFSHDVSFRSLRSLRRRTIFLFEGCGLFGATQIATTCICCNFFQR